MAQGSAYQVGPTSVNNNNYLDLKPSVAGQEVSIHNIYVPTNTNYELYWYDESNQILFDSDNLGKEFVNFTCTQTRYIRIKNISGAAAYFGADGIFTRA